MDSRLGPYDHLISLRRFIYSICYHLLRIIAKRCSFPVRLYQPTYSQFWLQGRAGVSFTYSIQRLQDLISKWTNSPYTLMNFDWENGVGLSFKSSKCVLKIVIHLECTCVGIDCRPLFDCPQGQTNVLFETACRGVWCETSTALTASLSLLFIQGSANASCFTGHLQMF